MCGDFISEWDVSKCLLYCICDLLSLAFYVIKLVHYRKMVMISISEYEISISDNAISETIKIKKKFSETNDL